MKKYKPYIISEGVPEHFGVFLKALFQLEILGDAHSEYIITNTDCKQSEDYEYFTDEPTVFSTSAYIYLCSAWESYIEDIIRNYLNFIINNIDDHSSIPKGLKKNISKEIKAHKNELSAWDLAGNNWKNILINRFEENVNAPLSNFHSLKVHNINKLFYDLTGIENICHEFHWKYKCDDEGEIEWTKSVVASLIDGFVSTRGSYAHGKTPDGESSYSFLIYIGEVLGQCAVILNNHLSNIILEHTSKTPWAAV